MAFTREVQQPNAPPPPRIFIHKADSKAGDALYEAYDWVAFGRSFQQSLQWSRSLIKSNRQ